jgi:hypothetical protein
MLPSPTIARRVSGRNLVKALRTQFGYELSKTNKKSAKPHTAEQMHRNQKIDLKRYVQVYA